VLYRLRQAGFRACLVGGGVRDLILGREPKDFDVVTDARPEQLYKLFRNCRLIGRRFRLAHVQFDREIIEVATFRSCGDGDSCDRHNVKRATDGRIIRDNAYGSIEEDVWRRDFTINALYYDIENFAVLDYVGGFVDLKAGLIRSIGNPRQRYQEDPVRMLRAVRFAAKLGFNLENDTEAPLYQVGYLLKRIPPARLFDEVLKLLISGNAVYTFELLRFYRLLGWLFPGTENYLQKYYQHQSYQKTLLNEALVNIESRISLSKSVNPAFLLAALLWEPLEMQRQVLNATGLDDRESLRVAADMVIQEQSRLIALPRRYSLTVREIWEIQQRMTTIAGKYPLQILSHPLFRAGYDFLLLRAKAGERAELAEWWTHFLSLDEVERANLVRQTSTKLPKKIRKAKAAVFQSQL
jgi:poly(A) polymerase